MRWSQWKAISEKNSYRAAACVAIVLAAALIAGTRPAEASDAVRSVDADTFGHETAQGVVLVDFWATWCGPCQRQGPVLEELAEQYGRSVRIIKVNVDENRALASRLGVNALPTLMIYSEGKPVTRFEGLKDARTLSAAINQTVQEAAAAKRIAARTQTPPITAPRTPARAASYEQPSPTQPRVIPQTPERPRMRYDARSATPPVISQERVAATAAPRPTYEAAIDWDEFASEPAPAKSKSRSPLQFLRDLWPL